MRAVAIRVSVGAMLGTLSALFAIWRDRRHEAARERELETFSRLLAGIPTDDLGRLRSDYATLAAFDANPQFRRKRDACTAELARRAGAEITAAKESDPRRSVSLWDGS